MTEQGESPGASPLRRLGGAFAVLWLAACAFDPVAMDPPSRDPAYPASMSAVSVLSSGDRMNGVVYQAQGEGPHPTVVLLHGYPGDERNLDLAQAVRRAGWNVLFFHYRGAWGSQGEFSFGHALEDVAAGVRLIASDEFSATYRSDAGRIALVGHSMGGFLALTEGSGLEAVDCIASLAGGNPGILARAVSADPGQAAAMAESLATWSGPIRGASAQELVAEITRNADRFDPTLRADALSQRTLLLVAGARDAVTPPAIHHTPLVQALEAAGAPRLTVRVLESDHAFSDRRIALAEFLVSWLEGECR